MEIKARYILIGFFTLAVITAGFAFVYWLETTGGLAKRTAYVVRFQSTVSGLLPGSAVLFNGIRVGEVTRLRLVPENPREVDAAISVDASTPIREDTQASLDFQGLTGVPVVILTGASSTAPLLAGANGQPPVLAAVPDAGQTLSASARQTLQRVDKILGENSDNIRTMITNLSSFAEALGRNSGRVDTILAGLERMTGGAAKAGGPAHDLAALQALPAPGKPLARQLIISEPTALIAYETEKLLVQQPGGEISAGNAKWADSIPKLVQIKLIQSFENVGYLGQVSRPLEGAPPDYQLALDIRRFQIVSGPEINAEVEFGAKVVSPDGHISAARVFKASVPSEKADGPEAMAALSGAFGKAVSGLIPWAVDAVAAAGEKESALSPPLPENNGAAEGSNGFFKKPEKQNKSAQ